MPISAENKARYPKDWRAISARIRKRARHRCESCGLPNGALGGRDEFGGWWPALAYSVNLPPDDIEVMWPKPGESAWCGFGTGVRRLKIIRIVLTVAHLNHTPEDCRDEVLRCWCQQCHLRYDAKHKAEGVKSRNRAKRASGDFFETQPWDAGAVATIVPLVKPPLFIPLKEQYFDAFERGDKDTEWRAYGKRWNENTCPLGRRVTLSMGYGKHRRLDKMVLGFAKVERESASEDARAIFKKVEWFAAIKLGDVP